MKAAVIIPARAGSKGIPGKNMQRIGGRTLIRRCAMVCTSAGVGPVYVSTDSLEIGNESGVSIIMHPPELASDTASSEAVMEHALGHEQLADVDIAVMVQCTAPWVQPDDIRGCVEAVEAGAGSAIAACRFHGMLWEAGAVLGAVPCGHSWQRERRQDVAPRWLEAGSVYAYRVDRYRGSRFVVPVHLHEVPAERVFEIDEPWQLEMARNYG